LDFLVFDHWVSWVCGRKGQSLSVGRRFSYFFLVVLRIWYNPVLGGSFLELSILMIVLLDMDFACDDSEHDFFGMFTNLAVTLFCEQERVECAF